MSEKTIFSMSDVSKVVPPSRDILKNINLSFFYGAKIGVLGLNGSGKSSLLKIIAGLDKEYIGEVTFQKDLKIGLLEQEPQLDDSKTVLENVEDGVREYKDILQEFEDISMKFAEPMSDEQMESLLAKQARLQDTIDSKNLWDLDRKIEIASNALNLPEASLAVTHLSGGEKRRIALARLLLSEPDVLLLDEPTNHLDALSVAWLERYLEDFPGTVIAVTHDRYFLDNVAGWILELDRGRGIPFKGNYSDWLEARDKRLNQEKSAQKNHEKAISQELEWVRSGAKGRQKKGKARLNQFEELSSKQFQERAETNSLYIPPGPRLGGDVLTVENLAMGFDHKLLFENLSFVVPAGAVVGIIGANGVGKSTLFKLMSGQLEPKSGSVKVGSTVQISYIDQHRDHLDDKKTVWEEISDGLDFITVGNYVTPSRQYVGRFNFTGTTQQKTIGSLSGGERNRVHLAKLLRSGGNVLLLDEPTNDLDVETLRALEEALDNFPGSALVISHDRWFLDRVATHILAFHDDGSVHFVQGSFTDYAEYFELDVSDGKAKFKYKKLETIGS